VTEPPHESVSPSRRKPFAPLLALTLALVLGGLVFLLARAPSGDVADTAATPLLNQPAPALGGKTLSGTTFDLATRRGSWVVLNFFSTTCTPCRQEHSELVAFHDAQAALPAAERTELVTDVFFDSERNVRQFFAEEGGGDWPVVLDSGNVGALAYSVVKVPETWIIDPNGLVRAHVITTLTAERLDLLLARVKAGA
jgi:cytochrome c biogenesis protein CcmG, thiol:disulfide interchange protein DsbE